MADLLGVLAGKHRYNPVEVMLKNAPAWDGVDRVEQLYKILCIEDDELSKTLLHKWLWQCYSMAHNDTKYPFGADGLLVLQGKQGIGKTSFVRKIGVLPELVKLGQYLDSRDKDTIRRCTSCWICEWGEIETTLRSDLERLKAFITAEIDEYRLPYGRTDQTLCRRTSLIATCRDLRRQINDAADLAKIEVEKLTAAYIAELEAENHLNGGALTEDAQLLSVGVKLRDTDLEKMFDKHAGNYTMQRLIADYADQNGIRIRRAVEYPNGYLIQTVKNVPYVANKSVGWHTRPEFYEQFMGENSELAQIMNG